MSDEEEAGGVRFPVSSLPIKMPPSQGLPRLAEPHKGTKTETQALLWALQGTIAEAYVLVCTLKGTKTEIDVLVWTLQGTKTEGLTCLVWAPKGTKTGGSRV